MTSTPAHPNLITYNLHSPDLNSASATRTPTFTFPALRPVLEAEAPLILLSTSNPVATCLHIKSWLLKQHDSDPAYSSPGILRMEYQALEKIEQGKAAWVLFAPGVARLDTGEVGKSTAGDLLRVSVIAVLVKSDPRVRWFYTLFPAAQILEHLDNEGLVRLREVLEPTNQKKKKFSALYTWLREAFLTAIRIPDSPDWIHAQGISDYCPSIRDSENAMSRLEQESHLYWNTPKPEEFLFADQGLAAGSTASTGREKGKPPKDVSTLTSLDPSDDRYLHALHPAEREVASLARLKCAEYLFFKRNFFRAFWEEVYRSDKTGNLGAAASSTSTRRTHGDATAPPQQTDAASPAAASSRQDTPFSAPSTPAPEGTPAPAAARGRAVGFDRTRRAFVRTERAHQAWLEREYKCKATQAKILVVGWRVLGFLDEERYLGWVREGWGTEEEE